MPLPARLQLVVGFSLRGSRRATSAPQSMFAPSSVTAKARPAQGKPVTAVLAPQVSSTTQLSSVEMASPSTSSRNYDGKRKKW